MSDSEWFGEPHTLIVHSVTPPAGQFDDGSLDCDLRHPPSCKEEEVGWLGLSLLDYSCDVAYHERGSGLPFLLRYSGTPVTEPGTYRIQAWGRKTWTPLGYEYDGGVGVMPDPPSAEDVSTIAWALVQGNGHAACGGWSVDGRSPELMCACGTILCTLEGVAV